jgi:hypothetical protein
MYICKTHPGKQFKLREGKNGPFYSHMINPEGEKGDRDNWHTVWEAKDIELYAEKQEDNNHPQEQTREPIPQRNFEQEARGKIRHGLLVAKIQKDGLVALTDKDKDLIKTYEEFAMIGN